MSERRQQLGAAFPRQRRSGGVVGYVAELQQLDEESGAPVRPRPSVPSELTSELKLVPRRRRGLPGTTPSADVHVRAQTVPSPDVDRPTGAGPAAGADPAAVAADAAIPVPAPAADACPESAAGPVAGNRAVPAVPAVPAAVPLADHMRLAERTRLVEQLRLTGPVVAPDPRHTVEIPAVTWEPSGSSAPFGAAPPPTGTPPTGTPAPGTPAPGTPAPGTPAPGTPAGGTPATIGSGGTGTDGERRTGVARRRRLVLFFVVSSVLTTVAVGYALLRGPVSARDALPAAPPAAPAVTPPIGSTVDGARPDGSPVSTPASTATTSASAAPSGTGTPSAAVPQGAPTATPSSDVSGRVSAQATRSAPAPGRPPTTAPPLEQAPAPIPVAALEGTFTRTADVLPLGLVGYVGTIRLDNPGGVDALGWRVRITVPGGNEVVPGEGVRVVQNGEQVFFRPQPALAQVPAGGSVSFGFTVQGILAAEPSGCTVNGNPCG